MAQFVADTHVLVWHLTGSKRLGRRAKKAIDRVERGAAICFIPTIVLVEIEILYERNRINVSITEIVEALKENRSYAVLAFDLEQCFAFQRLASIKDPMDRMIASAANATDSALLSADQTLAKHHVEVVWD